MPAGAWRRHGPRDSDCRDVVRGAQAEAGGGALARGAV